VSLKCIKNGVILCSSRSVAAMRRTQELGRTRIIGGIHRLGSPTCVLLSGLSSTLLINSSCTCHVLDVSIIASRFLVQIMPVLTDETLFAPPAQPSWQGGFCLSWISRTPSPTALRRMRHASTSVGYPSTYARSLANGIQGLPL
jgi:hypothetical protein